MAEKEKRQDLGGDHYEKHKASVTPPAEATTQQDLNYDLSITAALRPDELAGGRLSDSDDGLHLDPQLVQDAITGGHIDELMGAQPTTLVTQEVTHDGTLGEDEKKGEDELGTPDGGQGASMSPELSDDDDQVENDGDTHNGARGTYKDKNKFVTDAVRLERYFKGQPRYKDHTARTCRAYVKLISDELVKLRSKMMTSSIDADTYQRACDEFEALNLVSAIKIKAYWYNTLLNVCQIYKSEYHNLYPLHFDARKRIYKRYIMDVNDWDTSLGDRLKPHHYAPAMEPSFVFNVTVYISEMLREKALRSVSGKRSARTMNANCNGPVSGDSGDEDDSDYENEDDEPPRKRRRRNTQQGGNGTSQRSGVSNGRGARGRRSMATTNSQAFTDESSDESGETVIRRRQGGHIKVKLGSYRDTGYGPTTTHAKAQPQQQRRKNIGVKSVADATGRAHPSKTLGNGSNNKAKNTLKLNEKRLPTSRSKSRKKLKKIPKYQHSNAHSYNHTNNNNNNTSKKTKSKLTNSNQFSNLSKSITTRTRKRRKKEAKRIPMTQLGNGNSNSYPNHHHSHGRAPRNGPVSYEPGGWDSGDMAGVGGGGVRLGVGAGGAAPVGRHGAVRHRRRDASNDQIAQDMAQDEQRPRGTRSKVFSKMES